MKRTAIIFSIVAIVTGSLMVNYAINAQNSEVNEPYSAKTSIEAKTSNEVVEEIVVEDTSEEEVVVGVKEEEFQSYTETVIDLLEPVEDDNYTHKIHSRGINLILGEKFDDWDYMGVEVVIEHTSPNNFMVVSVEKTDDFYCGC